jgi:hypothetical protein
MTFHQSHMQNGEKKDSFFRPYLTLDKANLFRWIFSTFKFRELFYLVYV